MESVGALCNKPLEKIKRSEEVKGKNDPKIKRLSWDGTLQSENDSPPDGLVKNEEMEFQPLSNIEEVFRDPSTFDFLSQIGSSNTERDLRKESLYVKFDPCLQPLKEESFSTTESNLSKRRVFHISNLVTSPSDGLPRLENLKEELPLPDLCLVEPLKTSQLEKTPEECSISKISQSQASENTTLIDIETFDTSGDTSNIRALQTSINEKKPNERSISNISGNLSSDNFTLIDIDSTDSSFEKTSSLKLELRELRALLVERELAHRERKKDLETTLQRCLHQKLMEDSVSLTEKKNLDRAIMEEYEESINSIKLEITSASIIFEQDKKKIEGDINRVKEHKEMTEKAYADLSLKFYNTEKLIDSLTREINVHKEKGNELEFLKKDVSDKMATRGLEFVAMVDNAFKEIDIFKQTKKKDLDLLETRIKTLKVKENSLNLRLAQVTAENESLTKMLDDATKGEKM